MTAGHRDPVRPGAPIDPRPTPGPISVLPQTTGEFSGRDVFAAAVTGAGGEVAELGESTRGVVWLESRGVQALVETLQRYPAISWVQLPWAGVDSFANVLASYADRADAPLFTSAKGAYSQPVAEHALLLVLATMRELPRKARSTSWDTVKTGRSLFGTNVVIVGAGGIALELMRLLEPFGVTVTIVRRTSTPVAGADRTVAASQLHDVLPDADVVVLAAAATASTQRMIGATEFALMKPTAVLVNIARGPLVDTDALLAALDSGALYGAGLDVTAPEPLPDGHPLWSHPRSVVTSHTADTPQMVEPLLLARVAANVRAFVGDARFTGVVDPRAGY